MTDPKTHAAQPPSGPSVALRALREIQQHGFHRKPKSPMEALNSICACLTAIDCITTICKITDAALATAPAEGVDGQEALREARDAAYSERNQCVALILRMALALGWRAGVGRHEDKPGETWEDDWRTLVSVDLPTGQASWHFHDSERGLLAGLPAYPAPWDGHDTPEKYRRVNAALAAPQPLPSAPPVGATHHCRTCKALYVAIDLRDGVFRYLSEKHCEPACSRMNIERIAEPLPSAKPQEVKCENPYHLKTGSHTGSTCYTLLTDQRFIPVAQSRVKLSPSTNCDCGLMVETHTTGDGSIREHKASCAVRRGGQLTSAPPSPEGPPATAGHNPEGVEDRGGKVPGVVCDYKTAWHSLVPHPETKSCIRPRAHPAEGPPAPGGEK